MGGNARDPALITKSQLVRNNAFRRTNSVELERKEAKVCVKKANFQVQNNNLSFRAVSQIDPIHVVCVRRNRGIE